MPYNGIPASSRRVSRAPRTSGEIYQLLRKAELGIKTPAAESKPYDRQLEDERQFREAIADSRLNPPAYQEAASKRGHALLEAGNTWQAYRSFLEAGDRAGLIAAGDAMLAKGDGLNAITPFTIAAMLDAKAENDALALHVIKAIEEIDPRADIRKVREDIRTATDSVDAIMLRIQRFDAFMKRLEKVEESIETYHAQSIERSDAINARLTELIEELKKPKKSWFT